METVYILRRGGNSLTHSITNILNQNWAHVLLAFKTLDLKIYFNFGNNFSIYLTEIRFEKEPVSIMYHQPYTNHVTYHALII